MQTIFLNYNCIAFVEQYHSPDGNSEKPYIAHHLRNGMDQHLGHNRSVKI